MKDNILENPIKNFQTSDTQIHPQFRPKIKSPSGKQVKTKFYE